jgi:hypothetical protein
MNSQVVPEHRPRIDIQTILGLIGLILLALFLIGVIFALNWTTWGKPGAIILCVVIGVPVLWRVFVTGHDRYLHHATVRQTHIHAKTQRILAERAMSMGHSVSMKHTDHLGGIHELQTISPLTIPNAPVTIKELNWGDQAQLAPVLPTAPAFSSLISQIKPGHLFLAQGATAPIWGDITDLLSTLDVGRPGTGKSTLLRMVCGQVLLIGGRPIIMDPHGSILDDLGSEFECAESPEDISSYAGALDGWLTKRLQERRAGRADFKPTLLLVDEMPIISEMSPDALPAIRRVVLEGRKVGMYALISGQGVPSSILGGTLVRDAMASRYVFCTSPQQARMAGIENETAKSMMAILEDAGPGKAVLATSNRRPEIVAIPDTTTDDIRAILDRGNRSTSRNGDGNGNVPRNFRNNQEQPAEPLYYTAPDVPVVPGQDAGVLVTVTSQEREQIVNLARAGVPRREMCLALGKGKYYYDTVKQVLDEEGL